VVVSTSITPYQVRSSTNGQSRHQYAHQVTGISSYQQPLAFGLPMSQSVFARSLSSSLTVVNTTSVSPHVISQSPGHQRLLACPNSPLNNCHRLGLACGRSMSTASIITKRSHHACSLYNQYQMSSAVQRIATVINHWATSCQRQVRIQASINKCRFTVWPGALGQQFNAHITGHHQVRHQQSATVNG